MAASQFHFVDDRPVLADQTKYDFRVWNGGVERELAEGVLLGNPIELLRTTRDGNGGAAPAAQAGGFEFIEVEP